MGRSRISIGRTRFVLGTVAVVLGLGVGSSILAQRLVSSSEPPQSIHFERDLPYSSVDEKKGLLLDLKRA